MRVLLRLVIVVILFAPFCKALVEVRTFRGIVAVIAKDHIFRHFNAPKFFTPDGKAHYTVATYYAGAASAEFADDFFGLFVIVGYFFERDGVLRSPYRIGRRAH